MSWFKDIMSKELGKGQVALTWFNDYSGVVVKTSNGTIIVFDPYEVKPDVFTKVDILIITHEHFDHYDPKIVKELSIKYKPYLCCSVPVYSETRQYVASEKLLELRPGTSYDVLDVKILAFKSKHPAHLPVTVLLKCDGVSIYHASDSQPTPEMSEVGQHNPDIALCTVGIAPGASPKAGVEIAKLVKPKIAIPYHTDDERDLYEFSEIASKELPDMKVVVIKKGSVYVYP
ncbi:MAG: hypothetical protein DRJ31_02325 [Candidatus Methanomethylicota archaeon]|uniref:MBL fold metallo-hydrolase n=1 Tax=Thermoproteota archaeon TaxID=2056631 RepID=A0A497EZH3_9CREN|nr:MAG: hypothetical protein DRJ31_02325 [Candidatus Verstraetearchaeota archaeon]RLE52793.1 MAG: hypothetical protein DRJ33_02800 [Candidatus Verstraetearchaeota archaeon]